MSKEYHANIFEAASNQSLAKKKTAASTTQKTKPKQPLPKQPPPSDQEIEEMFHHIRLLQDSIENSIQKVCEGLRLDPKKIADFSQTIQALDPELIERNFEILENTLEANLGTKIKKETTKQQTSKAEKSRRGKMLPGKKRWMPVP